MVPHFGQGAGQAIEDGFALAILLENAEPADVPARLKAYEQLRLCTAIRTAQRTAFDPCSSTVRKSCAAGARVRPT
jgi:2-polyprenyl-6-methoxyphenol hydroxylase-like FAD-dependent oxidoreductase